MTERRQIENIRKVKRDRRLGGDGQGGAEPSVSIGGLFIRIPSEYESDRTYVDERETVRADSSGSIRRRSRSSRLPPAEYWRNEGKTEANNCKSPELPDPIAAR